MQGSWEGTQAAWVRTKYKGQTIPYYRTLVVRKAAWDSAWQKEELLTLCGKASTWHTTLALSILATPWVRRPGLLHTGATAEDKMLLQAFMRCIPLEWTICQHHSKYMFICREKKNRNTKFWPRSDLSHFFYRKESSSSAKLKWEKKTLITASV